MLSLDILPILDLAMEHVDKTLPSFALGNQVVADRDFPALEDFASNNQYNRLKEDRTVSALLEDRYGIEHYEDCDLNGKAMHCFDFGQPIEPSFVGKYSFCFNDGSTMMILDQRVALNNMIELLAVNGVLLSQFTVNRHLGFYNYHPERILSMLSEAGLTLIATAELALYYDDNEFIHSVFTLGKTPYWEMERQHTYTPEAVLNNNGKLLTPHIGVWAVLKKSRGDITLGSHKLITR